MKTNRNGFTLVEMLVVLGIIVLLAGMFLPAVMRARKQSLLAECTNNLRQIGTFYIQYADRNDDYIPLGRGGGFGVGDNQYVWNNGHPSAAMGPFVLAKMVNANNAKLLYCPLEALDDFRRELYLPLYRNVLDGRVSDILSGYGVRPMKRYWGNPTVYPVLMPKLTKTDRYAIVAEHLLRFPYNHGTEANPIVNVLHGDGSVRVVSETAFDQPLQLYFKSKEDDKEKYILNENDPTFDSVWQTLDKN